MPSVNLAYKNGVVPIQYQKLSCKVRPLPNQLEEYKGLPLYADLPIEILAGHQVLVKTGLDDCMAVADPEWIRQKAVHLGIKQWNNCAVVLLHPDSTSDKDV
ncbi:hypothetical protein DSO57_1008422 [Entomophthora muscae]|uniref:Uncharacterized protein n=1 Tax=Entomophthora muscae TaxID=34485 RepID=A0ACC2SJU2_9FUNG|nr:hypothetical protein DSO57_1008422 [Entomophthora muscae]